mmetsp:Transcript_29210/g.67240  ORF Transcript_29210/g.67240 Transcript_29210/m.67240 type:complete len:543 (-) Transcript_29210:15-1643(-)
MSKQLRSPPGIDTAVAGPPLVGSVRFSASGPARGVKSPCVSHLVLSPESPVGQQTFSEFQVSGGSMFSSPTAARIMQPVTSTGGRTTSSVVSGSPVSRSSPMSGATATMLSGVEVQTRLAASPKGTSGSVTQDTHCSSAASSSATAVFQCSPTRGAIPVPTQTIVQPAPTQQVVSGQAPSTAGHGVATWAAANMEAMAPRESIARSSLGPGGDATGPTIMDRPPTGLTPTVVEEDDATRQPGIEKVSSDGTVTRLVKTTVLFKCPVCAKVLPSRDEAAAHCLEAQAQAAPTTEAAEEAVSQPGVLRPLEGEAVAYDARGLATIVRQQDPSTGRKRTIVRNEDGSHDVFGESTVASLMEEKETKATEWLNGLSNHQLFGLNHEIGQRLVESSKLYQDQKAQYDKYRVDQDYLYFGLTSDASDKDLDVAYRKLARQMHPDKQHHKGVPLEQAKEQFQQMKKRYENLKQARAEAAGKTEEKVDDDEKEEGADEEQAEEETSIKYDPTNRDSLTENAHKMLKQLKQLRTSCHDISHNLRILRPSGD